MYMAKVVSVGRCLIATDIPSVAVGRCLIATRWACFACSYQVGGSGGAVAVVLASAWAAGVMIATIASGGIKAVAVAIRVKSITASIRSCAMCAASVTGCVVIVGFTKLVLNIIKVIKYAGVLISSGSAAGATGSDAMGVAAAVGYIYVTGIWGRLGQLQVIGVIDILL